MAEFKFGDATIQYQIWGPFDGHQPVLTLINGYTRGLSDFRGLVKAFEGHQVSLLSLDNRGSGGTRSSLDFSLSDLANDVVQLWAHLGIEKSSVLGISMGGLIAQMVLKQRPDQVEKLILVSTSPNPKNISANEEPWAKDLDAIEAKLSRNFSGSFLERNRLLVRAMARNIYEAIERDEFVAKAAAQRSAINSAQAADFEFQSGIPTLVVHGSEDQVIPVTSVELFKEKFSCLQTKVFEGKGHLLIAECPNELYKSVIDFISG
jgi:3-oxoadipate enol-lactonase